MNGWFDATKGDLESLIEHYTRLLSPKPGRRKHKAIAEIQRQRGEKLAYIERLKLEAAALFAVERALTSTIQKSPSESAL